ncbi:MAG: TIGR00282 family metallophosphoesterase [Denitrovibrio sp.]|nr:MAG: TIGR00282 family metallophosphoesterase [Denitrovibrio sp.]
MRILHIGDIIGRTGRKAVTTFLPKVRQEFMPDIIVANVENASGGFGITYAIYEEFRRLDVDIMTTGNHIWDNRETEGSIVKMDNLIRPANLPEGVPGNGFITIEKNGQEFTVINLIGRVFMGLSDCPFRKFDKIKEQVNDGFIMVDFHGEATSEKNAFGYYVDGKVGAVVGTHTHVQTSDERVLPKGTLFQTDVGMCGALNSVIGMEKEAPIERFMKGMPRKFEVEKRGELMFNALFFEYNDNSEITDFKRLSITSGD